MGGEFRVQPRTQAPKAMSMMGRNAQVLRQLSIHGLNDLPPRIDTARNHRRQLPFLIVARNRQQHEPVRPH